mgnify:CR=1 FL=1
MNEFRFGYADGYIGSPLKLSDDSLTLIGIRRGIERPDRVIVNFSKDTRLTEQEEKNLYFAKAALKLNNQGVIYED